MAKNRESEDKGKREIPHTKKTDFCFVIMPFGDWYDQYYKHVFRPAIEDAGLESRRADSLYRPSPIVHDIWSYTKEAKVILADLSGRNPNVLYELGLAHAIAKPAILVVESIEDIPFDLRSLRIINYDKMAPNWGDILRYKITQSIKETLEEPLKSIPSAFLEVGKAEIESLKSVQPEDVVEVASPSLPVSSVTINSFDKSEKSVSGTVVLSRNEEFWILVFAGKARGPYWLQGGGGELFSEETRQQDGANWIATWTVPEVYIGPDVVDLRAVAIFPQDIDEFLEAGSPDPLAGNAVRVGTMRRLPEPKVVSSRFDLAN